jgi:threonine dehydrogenase-like Zn-dependent dehydrogenase
MIAERRAPSARLLAVLSAREIGAERIISMSRHESRQKLVREFCATDLVSGRGEARFERVKELARKRAESALECVGTQDSMTQATQSTRPGRTSG